jgi:hypothetical protein
MSASRRVIAVVAVVVALAFLADRPSASTLPREVRIGHGFIGSAKWVVTTSREAPRGKAFRPCLAAQLILVEDGIQERTRLRACGSLRGSSVLVANSHGTSRRERTVLAMAFSPEARSVKLWLQAGKTRLIALDRLGRTQARRAGLIRYRYATLALRGPYCLRRYAIYDVEGHPIEVGLKHACSEGR